MAENVTMKIKCFLGASITKVTLIVPACNKQTQAMIV